jgi:colanic acid biosynthesis glycosyl transferase WcaI
LHRVQAIVRGVGHKAGSSRRAIFLNRFFYPDHAATSELLSDLAFALGQRGFRITVITSRLHYETAAAALPPRDSIDGVEIWRVWTSKRGRQRLTGRSLDYLSFYLAAAWRLWRLARVGDIIVAKTDPPLLSVMAATIARLRGARLVTWLQDIFPEVAEVLKVGGGLGGVAFRLMRPFRNWSLHSAHTNVVVGEGMATRLMGQGIARETIRVIPNWSDGALILPIAAAENELRKSWALNDRFVVGYAGNLGRAHDVATIIEAMTLLQERATESPADDIARQIMFVFIGGGVQCARLEREVLQRRLANVRVHPYQPRQHLAETLGVVDVHLVSLNPKLEGLIVPSKFYGIAAAGRPTLFVGAPDGEIALLVEEARCGFTVAPGDGTALMDRILQLARDPELCASMGERARAAFEQRWDKERAVHLWEEVLNAALQSDNGVRCNR